LEQSRDIFYLSGVDQEESSLEAAHEKRTKTPDN
jgi:hypothetical protein